jgi:hypothetical protein
MVSLMPVLAMAFGVSVAEMGAWRKCLPIASRVGDAIFHI